MKRFSSLASVIVNLTFFMAWSFPAWADNIVVFAAAGTAKAFPEIGNKFEQATGHRVRFSFAASGILAQQIMAGAPADVFVSADSNWMKELEKKGLVLSQDHKPLLSNQLVIIVPTSSDLTANIPRILKQVRRIAIADPKIAPAGRYAQIWLQHLHLWNELQPKMVPTLSVRAALAAVETEAAPLGLVYRSDAVTSQRVREIYSIPSAQTTPIVFPIARIAQCKKKAADEFIRFLNQKSAKNIFQKYGFVPL